MKITHYGEFDRLMKRIEKVVKTGIGSNIESLIPRFLNRRQVLRVIFGIDKRANLKILGAIRQLLKTDN